MQDGKKSNKPAGDDDRPDRIKNVNVRRDAAVEQARRAFDLIRLDLAGAVQRESEEARRMTELLKSPRVEGAIKKDPNAAKRRAEVLENIESRRDDLESTRKEIEEAMKELAETLGKMPVAPKPQPVPVKPVPTQEATPESTPESTPEKKTRRKKG